MAGKNKPIINLLENSLKNIEQAKSLFKEGKCLEAEKYFLKVIKSGPQNEQAHFGLGKVYHALHKLPEAEKEFKKAIRIENDNKYAYIELGKALVEQGKMKKRKRRETAVRDINSFKI